MSMNLSINPTYYCNFRCDFCYLTPEQLGDRQQINLAVLDQRLSEIPKINHIDLYGGEIGLLKPDYFYAMKDIIRKYYDDEININTKDTPLEFEDHLIASNEENKNDINENENAKSKDKSSETS